MSNVFLTVIMGIFLGETEARRRILRGRKTITRRYYSRFSYILFYLYLRAIVQSTIADIILSILGGTAIPAWSIAVIAGLCMLIAGGGLYLLMKKLVIDTIEVSEVPSYQPAMQDDV